MAAAGLGVADIGSDVLDVRLGASGERHELVGWQGVPLFFSGYAAPPGASVPSRNRIVLDIEAEVRRALDCREIIGVELDRARSQVEQASCQDRFVDDARRI